MSSEERRKILQMVADGKINAEEAANLMRVLDESTEDGIEVIEPGADFGSERSDPREFEQVRRQAGDALGDDPALGWGPLHDLERLGDVLHPAERGI
jgi:hypothetical protein